MQLKLNHSLLLLFAVALMWTSCKKDKTAPVITLIGDDVTLALYDSYTDAGATATDEEDGDITASINMVTTVDVDALGNYKVTYTVADEAGNMATKSRDVSVVMMRDNYLGEYNSTSTCSGAVFISNTQTVTADITENEISISPIYSVFGGSLAGTVSGQDIIFTTQTLAGFAITGTGSISDDAETIVLNLEFSGIGGSTCTITMVRQ